MNKGRKDLVQRKMPKTGKCIICDGTARLKCADCKRPVDLKCSIPTGYFTRSCLRCNEKYYQLRANASR